NTVGLALLEGIIQCQQHQEPVLITLFDTPAHDAYRQIFNCEQGFAAALLLMPGGTAEAPLATLQINDESDLDTKIHFAQAPLEKLYRDNPSAKVLALLQHITNKQAGELVFALSARRQLNLAISI